MEREVDSDGSDDEEEEGTEDNDFMPDFSFEYLEDYHESAARNATESAQLTTPLL